MEIYLQTCDKEQHHNRDLNKTIQHQERGTGGKQSLKGLWEKHSENRRSKYYSRKYFTNHRRLFDHTCKLRE